MKELQAEGMFSSLLYLDGRGPEQPEPVGRVGLLQEQEALLKERTLGKRGIATRAWKCLANPGGGLKEGQSSAMPNVGNGIAKSAQAAEAYKMSIYKQEKIGQFWQAENCRVSMEIMENNSFCCLNAKG